MMLWSYDFLSTFAKTEYNYSDMYAAYTFAVFDVFDALTILVRYYSDLSDDQTNRLISISPSSYGFL
jgi:hypothetical protein